jgi:ribosome-associated protein
VAISNAEPIGDAPVRFADLHHQSAESNRRSLQLAVAAAQTAKDHRGQDVVVLDLRELTPVFDYFVVASGTSRRQLHAMSDEIDHVLQTELHDRRLGIEGYDRSSWILLDYGTVVIHLLDEQTRQYYGLEDLWAEAKRVPWESPTTQQPVRE